MTTIEVRHFFETDAGPAKLYTLRSGGLEAEITDFGAHLVAMRVPDRDGKLDDVALGYDNYEGYRSRKYFLGATVGRCCNRIGGGRFTLNGKEYQLGCNEKGRTHLHGGFGGFDQRLWDAAVEAETLVLRLHSADGEDGYPGNLDVRLTVSLTAEQGLKLHYIAKSDADTLCSLTNHAYWNLSGHDAGSILDHELKLASDAFTEIDADSIPTGRVLPVEGTPMDFRTFHAIGERIDAPYEQLRLGCGYDHNFVLRKAAGLAVCAQVYDPLSGRQLTCLTDSPCIQLYTGNFLDGTQRGKGGYAYQKRGGFALETQFAPDAVNHPEWDSPILRAGQVFDHTTIYRFDTRRD